MMPENRDLIPEKLERQIRMLIQENMTYLITGGARGFDTLAAQAVLALRREFPHIRLILALPCREQTRGWRAQDRALYDGIYRQADLIHYTAEVYDRGCMMRRNRFMVDHSVCCIFYLTSPRSGTYKTVQYAMERGLRLCNILI